MASEQLEGNSPGAVEGFGIHELIIETPDHSLTTALLPETQLLSLFRSAKSRYDEICLDPRIAYATIYKKHAVEGGGPGHSQSHLIASQVIPPAVASRLRQARHHYGKMGNCVFCAALQEELVAHGRIVATSAHFIAIEPPARSALKSILVGTWRILGKSMERSCRISREFCAISWEDSTLGWKIPISLTAYVMPRSPARALTIITGA